MTVEALCSHNVATIAASKGIRDAARMMREAHVGDLLVTEEGGKRPIGIVTDRDIVLELVTQDVDFDAVTVGDIMTRDLVTVNKENGLEYALSEMQRKGVRRMPIVNNEGALVGVLSFDDVVDYVARLLGHMGGSLRIEHEHEMRQRP